MPFRLNDNRLLLACVAGSIALHALVAGVLPGWQSVRDRRPPPLTVELEKLPPEIIPPKPLPMETPRPQPEPRKAVVKQAETRPTPERILTAPPEAPPSTAAPVIPDPRPAPPPEAPRPPPSVAPAPVTPPRSDAAYLNNPRPAYPLAARRRGDQGTVLIRVVVNVEGLAASVGIEKTSGYPALDEAALTAVKSWRFVPARQGGQAIESPYVVPVVFRLE